MMARLDFTNARIGARRRGLLGPDELRALLARPTLEARLEALRASHPRAVFATDLGSGAEALARLEAALRADVRRETLELLAGVEGDRARALLAAFLSLDEAAAVKAILRGVLQGAAIDRTLAAAPPVPSLPEAVLRAAAGATTLAAAVEALLAAGSGVAGAVRAALPGFERHGLLPLELAADRAAFGQARSASRGGGEDARILSRHLADRVDARNVSTLLALAGASAGGDWFLAGGRRLDEPTLRRLRGASTGEVLAAVAAAFRFAPAVLASPWATDRAIERAILAPLRRDARLHPLSLAVPLAYVLDRRAEVRRVAVLLRGAALGLPGEEILDLVEA